MKKITWYYVNFILLRTKDLTYHSRNTIDILFEETTNGQLENTIFRQRQENPVTWIQIIIISVGCLLAVMVIVHVVISIVNCVNVTQKITDWGAFFLAHLSWNFEWILLITFHPASVCSSVCKLFTFLTSYLKPLIRI